MERQEDGSPYTCSKYNEPLRMFAPIKMRLSPEAIKDELPTQIHLYKNIIALFPIRYSCNSYDVLI